MFGETVESAWSEATWGGFAVKLKKLMLIELNVNGSPWGGVMVRC